MTRVNVLDSVKLLDSVNLLEQWWARLAPPSPAVPVPEAQAPEAQAPEPSSNDRRDSAQQSTPLKDTLLLSVTRDAMACEWEVLLNQHQFPQGAELAMAALDVIDKMENLLSIFRPHSDLSTINRFASQRPIPCSIDTITLLELALHIHQLTEGGFDITAGSLSQVWGFSRRSGRMPTLEEIKAALEVVGTQWIELNLTERKVKLLRDGVTLNPGGIGKGYALDCAAQELASSGVTDFLMHGGLSSVFARGNRQHHATGGGWLVTLKHPWRWQEELGQIRLVNQALATSGSGKQFFHFQGQRYSHIIDPRTGWPAQGMMSATVICPSAAVADALATAMFVLGIEAAKSFCSQHPDVSAVFVYLDPKNSAQRIEAINLSEEQWIPVNSPQTINFS